MSGRIAVNGVGGDDPNVRTGYLHVEEPVPVLVQTPPHESPTPLSSYVPPTGGLGCGCPRCGPSERLPSPRVVEPGTAEHAAWVVDQERKRAEAEVRFHGRDEYRPAHWSKKSSSTRTF